MDNIITILGNSFSNPEQLMMVSVFGAVVFLVLGTAGIMSGQTNVKRRMKTRVARVPVGAGKASLRQAGAGKPQSSKKLAAQLEKNKTSSTEGMSALRRKLVQAGYMDATAPSVFYTSRLVLAAGLSVFTLIIAPFVAGSLPPAKLITAATVAAMIGFYLPLLHILRRTKKRQEEARDGFPDALDMLLVCVEAGLSLAAALSRVGQEISVAHPLLGEQFRLVALEMQAGKSREQALRSLADRVGIDDIRSLVTLLLQSDALGTSIGQSLRVHAEEMRKKRLVRAEEHANKLPVKMTIPLIAFILPSLFSVIMTPLIIQFIRVIGPALSGTN